jgi:hypothetical protein
MTSLRQKLIEYIKLHHQVHFRDIEKYAEDNGYKAYTATRRLQEVRNPKDSKHYNVDIGALDEDGKLITSGDATIKWYIYKPAFVVLETLPVKPSQEITRKVEQRAVQPASPRINDFTHSQQIQSPPAQNYQSPTYQEKRKPQPYVWEAPIKCCPVAILCQEKNLPLQHSQKCLVDKKATHS